MPLGTLVVLWHQRMMGYHWMVPKRILDIFRHWLLHQQRKDQSMMIVEIVTGIETEKVGRIDTVIVMMTIADIIEVGVTMIVIEIGSTVIVIGIESTVTVIEIETENIVIAVIKKIVEAVKTSVIWRKVTYHTEMVVVNRGLKQVLSTAIGIH